MSWQLDEAQYTETKVKVPNYNAFIVAVEAVVPESEFNTHEYREIDFYLEFPERPATIGNDTRLYSYDIWQFSKLQVSMMRADNDYLVASGFSEKTQELAKNHEWFEFVDSMVEDVIHHPDQDGSFLPQVKTYTDMLCWK